DAVMRRNWEEAARQANGLSNRDLRAFLDELTKGQDPNSPDPVYLLHAGAIKAAGVGPDSAVAIATDQQYLAERKAEDDRNASRHKTERAAAPRMKVFPLRMPKGFMRYNVAPLEAHREGDDIVVKQPLNA